MEDPSFGFKGIHIANEILEYLYVGLVMMCFILALGNRPQGSKWTFTLAFVGFAILTVYMTVREPLGLLQIPILTSHPSVRRHIYRVQGCQWPLKGKGRPHFLGRFHGSALQKYCALDRCDNGLIPDFLLNLRTEFLLASCENYG